MAPQEPRALLLSMPWAALGEPSLGLGVLKACLERVGITARVRHLNLFLLRYLRASSYVGLANAYALNDFVFTYDLDPNVTGVQYRLIRERLAELAEIGVLSLSENADEAASKLIEARRTIFSRWLDECAEFVVEENPTLVGFTCLFDQTISSIALARRIRERSPKVTIALGGYGLEGPVAREALRCFPWIDAVCLGEGEPAIVELARASAGQRPLAGIPNILTRDMREPEPISPRYVRNLRLAMREPIPNRAGPIVMDESPAPSFDDYFADLDELNRVDQVEIEVDTLPVEASRGCWWGQKHHCVFCGIDDETMQYRARSPEKTLAMLGELSRRYGVLSFRFSDYILPHTYFQTLLPALAARPEPYHLECEIKANLTAEHFNLLRSAGFGECQPGIESFSSSVLSKMCKGVTGIRNVQTLVLGKMNGIRIHYNFLFGFPTDELAEYEAMLTIIPLLYHLDPPHGRQQVEITRFAPLQADPERFGIRVAPHAILYDAVFSPCFLAETGFDLDAYAYYFERTYANSPALQRVYALLSTQIDHWKTTQAKRTIELVWSTEGEKITFRDSRYSEEPAVSTFGARHQDVFLACAGTARSIDTIAKIVNLPTRDVISVLEELVAERVVLQEDQMCLGLAIPTTNVPVGKKFRRKWVVA
jgi:ribosomal peptide maturation radical SAM protein 1